MGNFNVTDKMVSAYMAAHNCSEEKAREELSKLSPQEQADLASIGGTPDAYGDYFNPKVTKYKATINGEEFAFIDRKNDDKNEYVARNEFGKNPVSFFKSAIQGMFHIGSKEGSLIEVQEVDQETQLAEATQKRREIADQAKIDFAKNVYKKAFDDPNAAQVAFNFYLKSAPNVNPDDLSKLSNEQIENAILTVKNTLSKLSDKDQTAFIKIVTKYIEADKDGREMAKKAALEEMTAFIEDAKTSQYIKQSLTDLATIGAVAGTAALASTPAGMIAGGILAVFSSCSVKQETDVSMDLSTLANALDALKAGQDVTNNMLAQLLVQAIKNGDSLQDIKNLCGNYFPQILTAVVDNNALLKKIQNDMNMGFDELAEAVYSIENAVKDLTALIQSLPASIKSEFQGDLNMIINLIKSGNADISSIRGSIEALAGKIDAILNQVTINGATQQDIKALLEKIRNTQTKDSEKLLLMLQLLKHIDFTTVQISGQLAELNNNIKVQLGISQAILDKINEQGDKAEAFYNAVLTALANLGDENKAQFTALLNAIVKNGGKLDDITALLNAINKNITDGRKEAKEIGKQTVDAINKLGVNMSAGFAKVLAQGDVGIALMKEILDAIKNLNIGDGSKTEAYLQAILEAINGNTQELKDMTELLKTINNNVVQNGKDAKEIGEKILEAIKTLGTTTAEGFKALLEQGKLSLAKMDEILNAIKALDANTQANLKVIINSGKVNMDKILEFLAKIEKNGNETNVKLDDMNVKADAMIAGINEIIELLKKGFKDIEVKIEDHDVKVTVDVTGKVECKCTCDGHSPNEGIITELNNLFG